MHQGTKTRRNTTKVALCCGFLALIGMLTHAGSARAAGACYSPQEAQAEHTLRLHSELMVTAITCRHGSGGQDLVPAYTQFTKKNLDQLRAAEQLLIQHYKTMGDDKKALARLDRLRTLLANEYGQKIANQSAPAYCADNRDKLVSLEGGGTDSVMGAVQKTAISSRTYEPLCTDPKKKPRARRG